MIVIYCSYNRSIFGHVTQKLRQSSKVGIFFWAFIYERIFSKVCTLFLLNTPLNFSLADFSISRQVTQKLGRRSKLENISQLLSLNQCSRNFVHHFLSVVSTNPAVVDFPIPGHMTHKLSRSSQLGISSQPYLWPLVPEIRTAFPLISLNKFRCSHFFDFESWYLEYWVRL